MLPLFLLLLTVFVSSSHQQCFTDNDVLPKLRPDQIRTWTNIGHSFSAALFKELDMEQKKPHSNLIFSPWSIQHILLTAYFGAKAETEKSLARVLQLPQGQKKSLTWQLFEHDKSTNNLQKSPLKIASKIFLPAGLRLRGCIQEKMRNEIELIDLFSNQDWAKTYINDWVSERTDGQITDLVTGFLMYSIGTIVNAALLKGKWVTGFNPKLNEDVFFNVNSHIRTLVTLMKKHALFQHGHCAGLGARTLLLPYSDNRTAMILLLPDKDLDIMMDHMDGANIGYVTDKTKYEKSYLTVELPKFKSKNSTNLREAMKRFGSGKALTGYSDYSGFTGNNDIKFYGLEHEAVIEVDEQGATATTAHEMLSKRSGKVGLDFKFLQPFAYLIYDFTLKKVLFMGTFREPVQD